MKSIFLSLLFVAIALAVGYAILAYSMDITYDSNAEHASGSSFEAKKRGTLVRRILPHIATFNTNPQHDEQGSIEDIWIEKGWQYKPHGLLDRMRGIHPTTFTNRTVLAVRFNGRSAFEHGGVGNWEFSLDSTAAGGTFGKGYQMMSLPAGAASPTKLYVVRAPFDQSKPTVIADSIKLH